MRFDTILENFMLKSLKALAMQAAPSQMQLRLHERLPFFIQGPCALLCEFQIVKSYR